MVSLTDINAQLALIQTAITYTQKDDDKIHTYSETLSMFTVSSLLVPFSMFWEIEENIKRGMAQHP